MTDATRDAHEVQEPTQESYEQLVLFDMPAPEDEAAAAIADIFKTLSEAEAIQNSPEYKAHDLQCKADEIKILLEQHGRSGAIEVTCREAAAEAASLYETTGNEKFAELSGQFAAFAIMHTVQAEQEKNLPKEPEKESIVFCPEHIAPETGEVTPAQEFTLPAQLEEYRKRNPYGASQYEQMQAAANEEKPTINLTGGYNKKLDFNSPEFDADALKKAVFEPDENGETMIDRTQRLFTEFSDRVVNIANDTNAVSNTVTAAAMSTERLSEILLNLTDALSAQIHSTARSAHSALDAIIKVADFLQSETYQTIKENVSHFTAAVEEYGAKAVDDANAESANPLAAFIEAELKEAAADPALQNCTVADILKSGFDAEGNATASPFEAIIERAKERKAAFEKAQEITKLTKPLEEIVLHSIIPSTSLMPNNALINNMQQKPAINAGEYDVTVSNSTKNRNEIVAVVQIDYDESETGIKLITPNMTEYERQVTNAICSLWRYGHESHIFTSDMIYRTMTGQGSGGKATSGQKSAITRFMRKWEAVKITLDFSEEAKKRNYAANGAPVKSVFVRERFLNLREVTVKAGSETVTAWQLKEEPLILKYCELSKQVLSVPLDLLNIKEVQRGLPTTVSISNNDDRIAVKGNLLRRIAILKYRKRNKQEWSSVISFDTVFDETGLQQASKDKRSNMYSYIKQCLDFWKAEKWITGYSMLTKGKKITGVNIIL